MKRDVTVSDQLGHAIRCFDIHMDHASHVDLEQFRQLISNRRENLQIAHLRGVDPIQLNSEFQPVQLATIRILH